MGSNAYLSGCDGHLDLAAGRAEDLGELVVHALEESEAVVLGEGAEEVLDGLVGAGAADALLELGDDGALVTLVQGRRRQDGGELGVLGVQVGEGGQGLCCRVEGRVLDGGRVL